MQKLFVLRRKRVFPRFYRRLNCVCSSFHSSSLFLYPSLAEYLASIKIRLACHISGKPSVSCSNSQLVCNGFIFISANYRLLPPSTGHDIVQDLRDLFKFIKEDLNVQLRSINPETPVQVDANSIAVSGCSAGGLCAYLSVMHACIKPKAVIALYAMGGNLLASTNLLCHHSP